MIGLEVRAITIAAGETVGANVAAAVAPLGLRGIKARSVATDIARGAGVTASATMVRVGLKLLDAGTVGAAARTMTALYPVRSRGADAGAAVTTSPAMVRIRLDVVDTAPDRTATRPVANPEAVRIERALARAAVATGAAVVHIGVQIANARPSAANLARAATNPAAAAVRRIGLAIGADPRATRFARGARDPAGPAVCLVAIEPITETVALRATILAGAFVIDAVGPGAAVAAAIAPPANLLAILDCLHGAPEHDRRDRRPGGGEETAPGGGISQSPGQSIESFSVHRHSSNWGTPSAVLAPTPGPLICQGPHRYLWERRHPALVWSAPREAGTIALGVSRSTSLSPCPRSPIRKTATASTVLPR